MSFSSSSRIDSLKKARIRNTELQEQNKKQATLINQQQEQFSELAKQNQALSASVTALTSANANLKTDVETSRKKHQVMVDVLRKHRETAKNNQDQAKEEISNLRDDLSRLKRERYLDEETIQKQTAHIQQLVGKVDSLETTLQQLRTAKEIDDRDFADLHASHEELATKLKFYEQANLRALKDYDNLHAQHLRLQTQNETTQRRLNDQRETSKGLIHDYKQLQAEKATVQRNLSDQRETSRGLIHDLKSLQAERVFVKRKLNDQREMSKKLKAEKETMLGKFFDQERSNALYRDYKSILTRLNNSNQSRGTQTDPPNWVVIDSPSNKTKLENATTSTPQPEVKAISTQTPPQEVSKQAEVSNGKPATTSEAGLLTRTLGWFTSYQQPNVATALTPVTPSSPRKTS